MRGSALPAAMLCAVLGLMLAFAPRRAILPAIALLVAASLATSFVGLPAGWHEIAFLGCWASIACIALSVHLPRGVPFALALAFGLDAGLWGGAVVVEEGGRGDLLRAYPLTLLVLPAILLVERRLAVAVKVVSSWLIAVALLAALLPLTPTPGYVPDHME